jgi:hypothetical protein
VRVKVTAGLSRSVLFSHRPFSEGPVQTGSDSVPVSNLTRFHQKELQCFTFSGSSQGRQEDVVLLLDLVGRGTQEGEESSGRGQEGARWKGPGERGQVGQAGGRPGHPYSGLWSTTQGAALTVDEKRGATRLNQD